MKIDKKYFNEHTQYIGEIVWFFSYDGKYYMYSNMLLREIDVIFSSNENKDFVFSASFSDLKNTLKLFDQKVFEFTIKDNKTLLVKSGIASAFIPIVVAQTIPSTILGILGIYTDSTPVTLDVSSYSKYLNIRNDISTSIVIFNYAFGSDTDSIRTCVMVNNKFSFFVHVYPNKIIEEDFSMDFKMLIKAAKILNNNITDFTIYRKNEFVMVKLDDGVIFQRNIVASIDKRRKIFDSLRKKMYNSNDSSGNHFITINNLTNFRLPEYNENAQVFIKNSSIIVKNFSLVFDYDMNIDNSFGDALIQISYDFANMVSKFKEGKIYYDGYGNGNDMCYIGEGNNFYACVIPAIERQLKYEGQC